MIKELVVLGSGSAGLLAALTVKRKMPKAVVRIVRSPDIGIVGVGESTTPNVPAFLFNYLGLARRRFFELAEPTFKLGIHFLWGSRPFYEYPFLPQLDVRIGQLERPPGFYCSADFADMNLASALMVQGKAFAKRADGTPDMELGHAFHLENAKLVRALEMTALHSGIEFIDATISGAERSGAGISAVVLQDGRKLAADFFIDASGFRSELLGRALGEPYISYEPSLFNDRAILGSWTRSDEPILPYTTAETMDCGWSWQIEHEQTINRGYVYCSAHISDEAARDEFAARNPKAKISDRIIRFKTGRYQRSWVGNVMAIGNACGFVEPLEATSLLMVCWQCQSFMEMLLASGPTPGIANLFNSLWATAWDEIRDFLTLHFKTNTRLDTPYWRRCREEADASRLDALMEFYYENGPVGFNRHKLATLESQFSIEGYLVQLVGNQVPYKNVHTPTNAELMFLTEWRARNQTMASSGLTVKECLNLIRHPNWRWLSEMQTPRAATKGREAKFEVRNSNGE